MLIREVTTAEDKLRLLKVIIDNTWSAMKAEVQAEKAAQLRRAAAAQRKPRGRRATSAPNSNADARTASTAQKSAPQQAQVPNAEKSAAQGAVKGQAAAPVQQAQQRGVNPTQAQAKPKLYAPPKPLARYGKVVRELIR